MNTRKESKWMSLLVLCTFFVSLAPVVNAQDEVSTKIVGFVKAPMGQGYYYYSVPFKNIGDDEQIIFLNADYNDDGVLDGYSEGTFSNQNFSTGDKIYKFNPVNGSFQYPVEFKTVGTKTGWYEPIGFPPFTRLTSMAFTAGEGFVVQYANPPAEGGETYMLGEVNDETVEIPITAGFNVIGNPFPSNILISDAFVVDPDCDAISPTVGKGQLPFTQPITGDEILTGYNPTTNSWANRAVLWDNPNTPAADPIWCYAIGFPPFYRAITADTNLDRWTLKPGQAYMYNAKNAFIWKVDSPVASE
ncbi:MAG: hypothetical protein RBU23_03015 [Candidatus Auribacterota bacterium]|jgi:hypothetical protein|nr:hypothetical protein [Candidatus Auribacterota bacterium]